MKVYEVTVRVPVEDDSNPRNWGWEEIFDSAVELLNVEEVENFQSDDFRRVYAEVQE